MQSGREDTLEEWYAIKLCFKLGKNARETYGMLQPSCMNRASVFGWHKRFKEGRESVRDYERCGRSKEVKELGLGLGLLYWGFKGVQEESQSEEASTLQIGSVAFPPGQCVMFWPLTRPPKNAIPRWCTGRKWHIPMTSNRKDRKRSRGRIKAYNMGQGEGPTLPIHWCTGREWPLNCMTVISTWWRLNIWFQRSSGQSCGRWIII